MRQPGVKAFVIFDKKLLLILRDNDLNIIDPNKWNLPGGGINPGESPLEAIKRECFEEINIVPKNLIHLGKQTFKDGSQVSRYLANLNKEEYENIKLGNEGQEIKLFTINQISKIDLASYYKEYFNQYKEKIRELVEEGKIPTPKELGLE